MKLTRFLLIAVAGIGFTAAQEPPFGLDCATCLADGQIFFDHAKSARGIAFEEPYLYREVCTREEFHTFSCDRAVKNWWPGISSSIYNDIAVQYICDRLTGQNCSANAEPAPAVPKPIKLAYSDCDECLVQVARYSAIYEEPDTEIGLTYYLGSDPDGFCENPAKGFSPIQITQCQHWIRLFMPPAFQALNGAYASSGRDICYYWFDGLCPPPPSL